MLTLTDRTLLFDHHPLLTALPPEVTLRDNHFLHISLPSPTHRAELSLGILPPARFAAAYRNEPFWMRPATGHHPRDIPVETQFLFLELPNHAIALIVPLIDAPMRCSLEGRGNELLLVAESGTPSLTASHIRAAYIGVGHDLHSLCESAAAAIAAALRTTLRQEKHLPPFINHFGWCTWNAFYQEVSPENIRAGLQSFRAIGVSPKCLIVDDGWQSQKNLGEAQGRRLTALSPNEKFGGDLAPLVRMAKTEFAVEKVLVWHALQGYWAGIDPQQLPMYAAVQTPRDFSAGVRHHWPNANTLWGTRAAIIPPRRAADFFQDYHRLLAHAGVDGVKVDNQAALEGLAQSHGRVAMYQQYTAALEQSVQTHFAGNAIHCMACANDLLYTFQTTPLARTSTDFWPDKPETHGLHLWTNALVSTWFGQFIQPDWDMFQSQHPWAGFHAAARVLSGGPIYVSDKPAQHDAALLRKLVLSNGAIPRCDRPGMLTQDSLFTDPLRDPALLKIWNTNTHATRRAGVIGLFNCHHTSGPPVVGVARISDVPPMRAEPGPFVAHAVRANWTRMVELNKNIDISLSDGEWELLHLIPLHGRPAQVAIGLIDKLNAPAAVIEERWIAGEMLETLEITLRDGGELALWCAQPPREIFVDGVATAWKAAGNLLTIPVPPGGPRQVTARWLGESAK